MPESISASTQYADDQFVGYNDRTAGKLLGVSPKHVRNLRERNELRFARVGRRVVILRRHLQEYLDQNECGGCERK